jgi:pyruvate/2-oxoglutarate dehydrogenase complex dihydrolipoamide dehydrogenase (E3) component
MPRTFDAIVIGTGQSGPSLAARLAKEGRRTAVLERGLFGGTCVNNGCIPTKTMVASARAIHLARRGQEFGFAFDAPLRVDMKRIKARKDEIVRQSNEGIENWMKGSDGITVFEGHGRFEGPHTVRVNDEVLEAGQIFINVGARAFVPDMPGVKDVPFMTNSTIMHVDAVPEHLIIIGGSYIGLEFAQIYRRFGSRVTVVERGPRIISREDEDVSAGLLEVLKGEGIEFRLNATCISLHRTATGVAVGVDCANGPPEVEGSHILMAVGRRPNTDDLGVERAGIAVDKRGIITVDDQCRTSVDGVWAIGECNGHGAFTHTSYNDYEIVAANLFDGDPRRISDRITCYALYTDPPVGRAGMSLAEARASGRRVLVGERPMTKVSRAREMSETHGFMRALVDAETKKILGAVIFGHTGDEIVQSLLDVMYTGAPYTAVSRAMHIHPTISELVPTMLQELRPLDP